MIFVLYPLLKCISIFSAANNLAVESLADQIKRSGVLRVGLTGDYSPYSYFDGKTFDGVDFKMANNLADYFGVRLDIVKTTWSNLTKDLQDDQFDIAMGGISVNDERKAIGHFSDPVIEDGKRPLVRCENREKYTSVEAINKPSVRVTVNPGGTNSVFTKQYLDQATVTIFEDNRFIFKEIAKNREDVMITDGLEIEYQSARFPNVLCPANVPRPFDNFSKAYWMPHDDELRDEVNKWLARAKEDVLIPALHDYGIDHVKFSNST